MSLPFRDLYEDLQLSPNASQETIERVYRLLAKRYHPDNQATGDIEQFSKLQQAYEVLSDATRRAQYDVRYDEERGEQWKIFDQGSAGEGREHDRRASRPYRHVTAGCQPAPRRVTASGRCRRGA